MQTSGVHKLGDLYLEKSPRELHQLGKSENPSQSPIVHQA